MTPATTLKPNLVLLCLNLWCFNYETGAEIAKFENEWLHDVKFVTFAYAVVAVV
jgi:hypothetical protein